MRRIERAAAALLFVVGVEWPAPGQQGRSEAQLQIDVEHASLKEQLARDVLARRQALAKQGLVSEADLRSADAELRLAELETLRARINYTNELPSFRIVAARKSAPQGGPVTVAVELLELPQANRGGVRQYLVSLRDANSIIGEPYQASLTVRGIEGRRHRLSFQLLRDTDEVTVVIVSGTRREEVPVYLQRGGREDAIVVRAQNFSQEAALDDKADYVLDLERYSSGSRDLELVATGLPAAMTHEWIDASTKARLSSFRFANGQNGARVVLRVFVPADAAPEWFGQLLPFRAEVREGERTVGAVDLQLRPVGAPRLALLADNLLVVMDRSTSREVVLALENTGGVAARDVRVEADVPIGFEAEIAPTRLAVVAPGQRARVSVRLRAAPDSVPGEYNLKVRASAVTRLSNVVIPEQSFRLVLGANGGWVYLGFAFPLVLAGLGAWWFLKRRSGRRSRPA